MSGPNVSIVIPVYNEEGILHSSVVDLVTSLDEMKWDYEILLAENGRMPVGSFGDLPCFASPEQSQRRGRQ